MSDDISVRSEKIRKGINKIKYRYVYYAHGIFGSYCSADNLVGNTD